MFWFTVVTTDEYNGMAQDGVPQCFDGGLRQQGGWHQLVLFAQCGGGLVFLSLPHERETFGLLNGNHGGGILPTRSEFVLQCWTTQSEPLSTWSQYTIPPDLGARTSTSFPTWKRTILRVMSLDFNPNNEVRYILLGTMTLCGILDMQSISRAFYYNGRISVTTKRTISSTTQSYACAWTHLGLEGTSFLSMEVQEMIQQFRIYNRLNTNYVDRQLESQRGHKGHKQWILDTQVKEGEANDDDNGNDGDKQ